MDVRGSGWIRVHWHHPWDRFGPLWTVVQFLSCHAWRAATARLGAEGTFGTSAKGGRHVVFLIECPERTDSRAQRLIDTSEGRS
jgi:hypothetical protein